jgi:hypothetical protein
LHILISIEKRADISSGIGPYSRGNVSAEVENLTVNEISDDAGRATSPEDDRPFEKVEKISLRGGESVNGGTQMLFHEDPLPIDTDAPVETQQFTIRAVLVGCILGDVISASKRVIS